MAVGVKAIAVTRAIPFENLINTAKVKRAKMQSEADKVAALDGLMPNSLVHPVVKVVTAKIAEGIDAEVSDLAKRTD